MKQASLIAELADGEFHSGESLGETLNISRAAIWKRLKKLEDQGVTVESVKGKGYRIPGGVTLLDANKILASIAESGSSAPVELEVHDELDSTNSYLKDKSKYASIQGVICFAERQTQGRGRRGREWISPFGQNLYFSLGWAFEGGAASLEGLSLAVGVAVWRALNKLTDTDDVLLKWPNDLLFQGRKLGGILIEMEGDPAGSSQAIIGVGLNLGMDSCLAEMIGQPWADLNELGNISRNTLAAQLIVELTVMLKHFEQAGFSAFHNEWSRLDASRNKYVTLSTPLNSIQGVARGVAANGGLLVDIDGQVEVFHGGEISLRLTP